MPPPALAWQGGIRGAGSPARLSRRDLRQRELAAPQAGTMPQPCLSLLRSSLPFSFPFRSEKLVTERTVPERMLLPRGW